MVSFFFSSCYLVSGETEVKVRRVNWPAPYQRFSRSNHLFCGSVSVRRLRLAFFSPSSLSLDTNDKCLSLYHTLQCDQSIISRASISLKLLSTLAMHHYPESQPCQIHRRQTTANTTPSLINPPTIHHPSHNQAPQTGILEEIPSKFHAPDLSAKYLPLPVLRVGLPT
jgi:hypothetical protein